uniref:A to I editase domain-containing protein n=1 Tax=Macrostomum lignano TaxID=282301 RepID=A0A1I8F6M2_9PLAT
QVNENYSQSSSQSALFWKQSFQLGSRAIFAGKTRKVCPKSSSSRFTKWRLCRFARTFLEAETSRNRGDSSRMHRVASLRGKAIGAYWVREPGEKLLPEIDWSTQS